MNLTPRDLDILETLSCRVPLLSIDQVRRIWWTRQGTNRTARRRLRRLAQAGLVHRRIVNVQPPPEVRDPLVRWSPWQPQPDVIVISAKTRSRRCCYAKPTELYMATRRSASMFAALALSPPDPRGCHDCLLLADVYAAYRVRWPKLAPMWYCHAALPRSKYRKTMFQVVLVDPSGRPIRSIATAGSYAPRQVAVLHRCHADCALPYELW